ncbi:RNA polymerase II degradation factor 1-like [Poecilia latipinna]|uniref:RNA polymerase II degradation factor 1-like n=1 Tax=Poecilia latipinna TaxID=48699 RepID=UPI00072E5904|nr:PREDICTED: RNA polymerase II degradation factor 1-like [Poecilia latipinna]
MVDLNIQVDYDAVIFPVENDSPIEPEDQSEIQGESSPSGDFESPTSLEVEQETTSSAGFKITPSVENMEERSQHIRDLTKQVDDLKTELQNNIFELHKEREQRLACQAEVKSQQEEIHKLQTMLEKERHQQKIKDVSKVSCSSKITVDKSVLQQLEYFKQEAAKYASRNKGLIEVMVEEYKVRLKYEEQLKSHTEQASKFKAQEEMVKALQGQVADLKVELKLALENIHPRLSTQPETPLQTEEPKQRQTFNQQGVSMHSLARPLRRPTSSLQTEGSLQIEETKKRQTSNQPGMSEERQTFNQPGRPEERWTFNQQGRSEERQTSNQPGRSEERWTSNQSGRSEERWTSNQPGRSEERRTSNQPGRSEERQTSNQPGRSEERRTSNQPGRSEERQTIYQPGRFEERRTSNQTWRSEERQMSMRPTATGCMEGLCVGNGMKANLSPARPLHRPTPRWH